MYTASRWHGLPAAFPSNVDTMCCCNFPCLYAVPCLTLPGSFTRGPVEGWTPKYVRSHCQILVALNLTHSGARRLWSTTRELHYLVSGG